MFGKKEEEQERDSDFWQRHHELQKRAIRLRIEREAEERKTKCRHKIADTARKLVLRADLAGISRTELIGTFAQSVERIPEFGKFEGEKDD